MKFGIRSLSTVTLNRTDISSAMFQFLTCLSIGAHTPLSLQDAQRIRHFPFMSKLFHRTHSAKLFPRTLLNNSSNSIFVETASTAADFSPPFRSILSIFQFQPFIFLFIFEQILYVSLHQKIFSFCGGNVGRFPTSITGHMSTPGSATTLLTDPINHFGSDLFTDPPRPDTRLSHFMSGQSSLTTILAEGHHERSLLGSPADRQPIAGI